MCHSHPLPRQAGKFSGEVRTTTGRVYKNISKLSRGVRMGTKRGKSFEGGAGASGGQAAGGAEAGGGEGRARGAGGDRGTEKHGGRLRAEGAVGRAGAGVGLPSAEEQGAGRAAVAE